MPQMFLPDTLIVLWVQFQLSIWRRSVAVISTSFAWIARLSRRTITVFCRIDLASLSSI